MAPKPVLASLSTLIERFSPWTATSTFRQVRNGLSQDSVVLSGWLHRKPRQISKNLLFAVLRSPQGDLIQVVDNSENSPLRRLKPDSVVSVCGRRVLKKGSQEDAPEYDVHISDIQVLSESDGVAGTLIHEVKEWPQERRYIQLRQPQSQHLLRARSRIIKTCRDTLDDANFTEVETPLLFKSTPEGAREFFVPSRKKGKMYALPQSPQQYKQLLIASGIDRYYQVAKCFRDEDLRQDRQPEFTQLDLEMGFANGSTVRRVVERLVETVWQNHANEPLRTRKCAQSPSSIANPGTPLETMTYAQAIKNYGIDKPDLRYPYTFQTLGINANRRAEFTTLEALKLTKIELNSVSLEEILRPDLYTYRLPLSIEYGKIQDLINAANHFGVTADQLQDELTSLNATDGDIILLGDRLGSHSGYENPTPLGRARQLLIEQIENCGKTAHASIAVWMQEFPLFEPKEVAVEDGYPVYDYNSLSSTHHPFTMVALDDLPNLFTDPLSCHGQHYDLVVDGVELGGGSTRVHDAELQRKIFDDVLKITNSEQLFGHLLAALASGCPPHAGLAIGLDRMIAMLCGTKSIKDVIAFPKTISGADPVIGSPSKVTPDQLKPYHVKVQ